MGQYHNLFVWGKHEEDPVFERQTCSADGAHSSIWSTVAVNCPVNSHHCAGHPYKWLSNRPYCRAYAAHLLTSSADEPWFKTNVWNGKFKLNICPVGCFSASVEVSGAPLSFQQKVETLKKQLNSVLFKTCNIVCIFCLAFVIYCEWLL